MRILMLGFPPLLLLFEALMGLSHQLENPSMGLVLFMAAWMVLWWIFEILPLGITALVPLFFLPFFNIQEIGSVTPSYSNPVIFLFLGGFIIARALEKTQLDERLALNILKITGRTDQGIILGFVLATAFLSMWISNTATTVMMVPIALSVLHFLRDQLGKSNNLQNFAIVLFLSLAYSANIGGIMTPVGTPPNVVFLGFLDELYSKKIDFWRWLVATAPVALTLLAVMFGFLRWLNPFTLPIPKDFKTFIGERLRSQGNLSAEQKITIALFFLAAFLWIFKGLIHYVFAIEFLNDASIAIFCGFLLFAIPSSIKTYNTVLKLEDVSKLPWDIVLLFGGGMALAGALKDQGLIQLVTRFFTEFGFSHPYFLIFSLAAVVLFLTEIMSNVALCVVALPVLMKLGESQGLDPFLVALPAALCSSYAFSMPVSTPPNAIVFGTGAIRIQDMLRAGILLNFIALFITMTLGHLLTFKIF